ncbi:MAG: fused response regulator/phosphatase [Leptospiraceae bacterium]|nr:fused response regulator/phosphatase [Leptospiraceae bacterium]MCP5492947.1 fused response regulator/phosphatase [Leptospiraceae bacterium]
MDKKSLILIVDDNEENLTIISKILKTENYDVMGVFSGEDAIKLIKKRTPDLILMDIMMPQMDGIETCKIIHSDPQYQNIPILFLSAKNEIETVVNAFEAGGKDYVTKPFREEEILSRVKTHLKIFYLEKERESYLQKLSEFYEKTQIELDIAKETQKAIIAKDFPKLSNCNISSFFKPFNKIGGDLIAYQSQENGIIDILFGDVSGHGLSSALISGMIVLAFKIAASKNSKPACALKLIHELVFPIVKSHHLSAVYLQYDQNTRELHYSYAGHHAVVLVRDGICTKLEGKGSLVVAHTAVILNNYAYQLETNDKVLLYSDGLIEVENKETGNILGNKNFIEYLQSINNLHEQELLEELAAYTIGFCEGELRDDISMLLLELM